MFLLGEMISSYLALKHSKMIDPPVTGCPKCCQISLRQYVKKNIRDSSILRWKIKKTSSQQFLFVEGDFLRILP